MGPGDPLVVNSYISKCSMSGPKNSRFYEKYSETAASFTIFFNFLESRYMNSQSLSGRSFIALTHFHAVYCNDFVCVLRNMQIIILASFYYQTQCYYMRQFLAPKEVTDAFCSMH